MVPPSQQRGKKPQNAKGQRKLKAPAFRDDEDLENVKEALQGLELDPNTRPSKFSDLPLSQRTAFGLQQSHFKDLTDIQSRSIPAALKGKDILGAAKTGSGKTLAFLVPVLELLFREQWSKQDGLGALIISPTRELAAQIFEVLRKIGRNHLPSAGLIEGGMNFKEEAERIPFMNIIIGTPGRLLQHMDRTPGFSVGNLQVLVLDEADRILDMGFQKEVDALVDHLPTARQTMLFSATQTKKVSDLARLSLKEPEYIAVHQEATEATPKQLKQYYFLAPLPTKIDMLWSFIKANLKSKMIVFLSSSKQVRFVYECFRRLKPGIPLVSLYGRKGQEARLKITEGFAAAKYSCLIATDVVARGIDFPSVNWVVQADCPEDADTYIHRVGRTARYENEGQAVLFLDPVEEEGMLNRLEQKRIPIRKVTPKADKEKSIKDQIQELCFKEPDLKYTAQKAFTYYAQSVNHMKDKDVFQLDKLDLDGFAMSMGLPGAPHLQFQKGSDVKKIKNAPRAGMSDESGGESGEDALQRKKAQSKSKYDRLFERQNQDVLSSHYGNVVAHTGDDDEDFLTVKRVLNPNESDSEGKDGNGPTILKHLGPQPYVVDSKRREKALKSKKKLLKFKGNSTKTYFDEDGIAHPVYELQDEEDFEKEGPVDKKIEKFMEGEAAKVRQGDVEDKALSKEKRKEKKLKRKQREAEEREDIPASKSAVLGGDDAGEEDPLALMRSLPVAAEDYVVDSEEERPRKKPKKQKKEKRKSKGVIQLAHDPETLEDLEAVAVGLLGQ
ncbi:ATP-dependent RNA helicase DBP4 [Zalerion maritima]|uniref:ATP-dependent RNA helicase n=1 Tax=Zalerion maritima TaxID=339359 RepID=A0AAD5WMW6_9PEZI|nr:ATP-dependent RNA helicase DBP4 [Zalerion maritima]